jgi:type IV pilus assembly protein PilQ
MRKLRKIMAGMGRALLVAGIVVAVQGACSSMKEPELEQPGANAVEGINVQEQEDTSRVVITTIFPATYSVYRPLQPVRIMVDISEAAIAEDMPQQLEVNNGTINNIKLSRISGEGNSIARVEIGLEDITGYEVIKEENRLLVKVDKLAEAMAQETSPPPEMKTEAPVEMKEGDILLTAGPEEFEEWIEEDVVPAVVEVPGSEDVGVEGTPSVATPLGKASKLLDIGVVEKDDYLEINLITNGEVGDFNAFTLEKPNRIVLDLWKMDRLYPNSKLSINSQGIKRIRLGRHPGKLRLVFDVSAGQFPSYNFVKQADRLRMAVSQQISLDQPRDVPLTTQVVTEAGPEEWEPLGPESVEEIEGPPAEFEPVLPEAPPEFEPEPVEIPEVPAGFEPEPVEILGAVPVEVRPPAQARIEAIDFKYTPSASTIVIRSSKPVKYERKENADDKIVSILIKDAFLPAQLEKSYDTTEFQSPIDLISSFQSSTEPPEVNVTVSLNTMAPSSLDQKEKILKISFENVAGALGLAPVEELAPPTPGEEITLPPVGEKEEAPGVSKVSYAGEERTYHGAPIYLDAKSMDVLDALRLIAEVSGYNIIASDEVKGTLTMKLDNVPWDQALDLILQTKELGYVKMGNIYRIEPISKIRAEQQEAIKQREAQTLLKPLQVKVIPINYSKAQEIQRNVKQVLSDRGDVQIDRRSNSLIIRDIPEKIDEVMSLVAAIDRVTPEVLIEARIVEASVGFSRGLGVLWSTNYNVGPAWGNPTGLNFPNNIQFNQAVLGGGATASSPGSIAAISSQGMGAGISFGSLTDAFNLDLVLKTYETQNKITIISSPRILTMQDERATIEQGVSIPYPPALNLASGAAGGGQWQFINASLRLEVTPHISADKSIVMDLRVSNNEPNQKVVSGGSPSIDKKEANTTILVKDGETAVIGGIYKIKEAESVSNVPFLNKIPILGYLFRDKAKEKSKNELLVFITPRIIEPGKQVTGL